MKKSMRVCLAASAAFLLVSGTAGCSSALGVLSENPQEIARQVLQEITGKKAETKKTKDAEDREAESSGSGQNAGEENSQSASGGEAADQGKNEGESPGSRIVTEEQFLREYADRCLQQERSLYDYHEKNYMVYRDPDAWKALCFNDTGMLEDIGYDGIISTSIYDFDQDGHQELLILRLVQNPPKEREDFIRTDLEASMYEIEGEQVALADRKLLYEGLNIGMNEFRMEAFVKNTTYGVRLFCELDGEVFIVADGHFWYLRALEYADGRFWELSDKSFSESSWEPEEVLHYVDDARGLGLDVTTLLDLSRGCPGIVEQDSRTICLASVERHVNLTYEQYGIHRFQPGETLEYGFTEIRNRVEGQDALHLPAPETQELAPLYAGRPAVENGGDYIVPESSSRLLTDDEIARIPQGQLQMAINEIYARNGRRFQNPEIQSYFDGKSWYQGTIDPKNFSEDRLSKIERENIKNLVKALNR